ncbi:MAG TPA: hypothetical protein QGI72_03255 [Poseidonia sp.]|nr:hypothetical protein [Poseidonia sp.]
MGKKTFGSKVSFDIEAQPEPKRRRNRPTRESTDSSSSVPDDHINCPGCGASMDEDEWIQALIGFVSGAKDFKIGNPIRARVVQTLQKEVAMMEVPNPREHWELSVVDKLMNQINRIVQAEVLRATAEQGDQMYTEADVQHTITLVEQQTEQRVREELFVEIAPQIQNELEPVLRKQIEQELWVQFEEELDRRISNISKNE